jgi:hypothetical protein
MALAAFAAFVALFLIDRASLLVAPCSEYGSSQGDQKATNDDNCAAREGIIVAGIKAIADIEPEVWTALATIAIACFTLTLWLSTNKLWKAGEKQLIATQRPWVYVERIEIAGDLTFSDGEGSIPLRVTLKNMGNSPGIRVSVNVKLVASNQIDLLAEQGQFAFQFRRTPDRSEVRPELTSWPGDRLVFPIVAWMNSVEMPRFKPFADASPFPISLLAIVGCVDYEFSFVEGHHQTALIYDLFKLTLYPAAQFGKDYVPRPGAVLLSGTIPAGDLGLRLNFVGTGPID